MNPNGRIPLIQDQDFILYESNAIIRYFWEKFNFKSSPKNQQAWSLQDSWMDWTSTTLYYPNFREFYLYTTRTPTNEQDSKKLEQLLSNITPLLSIANHQLSRYPYIAGNEFSMADISFGVLIDKWERINICNSDFLNIKVYYEQLLQRQHFVEHVVKFSLDAI